MRREQLLIPLLCTIRRPMVVLDARSGFSREVEPDQEAGADGDEIEGSGHEKSEPDHGAKCPGEPNNHPGHRSVPLPYHRLYHGHLSALIISPYASGYIGLWRYRPNRPRKESDLRQKAERHFTYSASSPSSSSQYWSRPAYCGGASP